MTAILDTSMLIGGGAGALVEEPWAVSAMSIGELEAGVLIAGDEAMRAQRLRLLAAVLAEAPILPMDRGVALRYGELRAATGRQPTDDLWVAATALSHDFTLITADERQAALPLVRVRLVA